MVSDKPTIGRAGGLLLAALALAAPLSAAASPVDLHGWTAESYASVSGFTPGDWDVASDGDSVLQKNNGQPTLFYSDFDAIGSDVRGKIEVQTSGDDDFIGFVLGFDPGDTSSGGADYLLVDWKQSTQYFNFSGDSATDATPGSTADEGLAVSRVVGVPSADELWGHEDSAANTGGGVDELARGTNLGDAGWQDSVEYEFRFVFTATRLQVFVDDTLEADVSGVFSDGRLGFYNFSQNQVRYSAFTVDPAPNLPEPAAAAIFGVGLAGLGAVRRRRR